MKEPAQILEEIAAEVKNNLARPFVTDERVRNRIKGVCRQVRNRACARFLMACMLAKLHRPEIDVRKPYTEIGDEDAYSGRVYDEKYLAHFINENELPLNPTTAFLTPAFRNLDRPLTLNLDLIGKPREVYRDTVQILDDVHSGRVNARDVFAEIIRELLIIRTKEKRELPP